MNNQVNSLYYIGDQINRQFDNNKGANAQKNDAHFVELAAALSIVDFAYKPDQTLKAGNVSYEFGIKQNKDSISFKDLADSTKNIIAEPLTMFVLFHKFLEEYFPNNLEHAAWRDGTPIDGTFLKNTFYSDSLKNYRDHFRQWLAEMADNRRAFVPFDLSENLSSSLFDIVLGYKPEISVFEKGRNFSRIQHHCNRAQNGMKVTSPEDKFMSVMYKALETTVKEKYKF